MAISDIRRCKVSIVTSNSVIGLCPISSLHINADPFECPDISGLNRHYPVYASTMSQSDYRNAILLRYFFGFLAASFRNASVLPSSDIDSSFARHGLRPRHVEYALAFDVHIDTGFQDHETLGPVRRYFVSGLNTFTLSHCG